MSSGCRRHSANIRTTIQQSRRQVAAYNRELFIGSWDIRPVRFAFLAFTVIGLFSTFRDVIRDKVSPRTRSGQLSDRLARNARSVRDSRPSNGVAAGIFFRSCRRCACLQESGSLDPS